MKISSRIISIVLAVILLISSISVLASAQGEPLENALSALSTMLKAEDSYDEPCVWTYFAAKNAGLDGKYSELDSVYYDDLSANDILTAILSCDSSKTSSIAKSIAATQNELGAFGDVELSFIDENAWLTVALYNAKANDANVKFDEEALVKYFESSKLDDDGYNGWDAVASVDTTSAVILALKSIVLGTTDDAVKQAATNLIDKAAAYLTSTVDENGFYVGKGAYDSANSCSQSYAILALNALGKDTSSAVTALLTLQDDNGGFWYDMTAKSGQSAWFTAPDFMSTYESAMALSVAQFDNCFIKALEQATAPTEQQTTEITTTNKADNEQIDSQIDKTDEPDDDVPTGQQPFNIWVIIILIVAVVIVVLTLIPTFKKK